MIIQHNMPAMNTNRQLGISAKAGQKSTEKLSSGYRINRAGDDAAGLAISEKMRSQIRGLNRASANSQDGISLIQTAEGALNETQSILQRMRELAVQAANGTNTDSDRNEIQKEVNQLTSEINRIGNTTEFNTMKLLKGNTNKAEIGDVTSDVLKEGVTGIKAGEVTDISIDTKSKVGKESIAKITGNIADATGKVSTGLATTTAGVKGAKATSTVAGITFTANTEGMGNDQKITIAVISDDMFEGISSGTVTLSDGSTIGSATVAPGTGGGEIVIGLKQETIDKLESKQALIDKIKMLDGTQIKSADGTTAQGGAATLAGLDIRMTAPKDTPTGGKPQDNLPVGVGQKVQGTMSGEKTEVLGEYTFNIKEAFKEAGDTITILGQKFTAFDNSTGSLANPNAGEFNIFDTAATPPEADIDTQIASLAAALSANSAFAGYTITAGAAGTGEIKLEENTGFGGKIAEIGTGIKVEGSGGEDDYLQISTGEGQGLNGLKIKIFAANTAADALSVQLGTMAGAAAGSITGDTLEIHLGGTAAANTAENIQQAIRDLGILQSTVPVDISDPANTDTLKIDFSKFTVKAGGDWDKNTTGFAHMNNEWDSAAGGVIERKGEYSFDLTSTLAEGDEITVAGKKFIAKVGGDSSNGEIDITSKDKATQAAKIVESLLADNELAAKYSISSAGNKITLTEKKASGVDLKETDANVVATGTKGEYKVNLEEILKDGASINIDGNKIDISSKNQHVGYDKGTAIKETDSLKNQAAALADAINKNADMNYTAKTDDEGNLILMQKSGSENAPVISTTSSTKGTFDVTFQVGANTGQSMTIAIGDTRAAALGVASDGSEKSIIPDNGVEAFYTENQVVTDGTTNDNVEYALDVTSYEKATAAIGVIDDALAAISAQRSQLGAYQNRLEHTIANLDNTSENLQASESRIRDVDMAKEMSEFSKNNILQQAAQSMLAQANQSTQGVLTLLR